MNVKKIQKGPQKFRRSRAFYGSETGKAWVVISVGKEQWRRDAFTVSE